MVRMVMIYDSISKCSPGPVHTLPPLFGIKDHDCRSTYARGPAYSLASRAGLDEKHIGPGPAAYKPHAKMLRNGKDGTPAYSMAYKQKEFDVTETPGPAAYTPNILTTKEKPPEFSFGIKDIYYDKNENPAPNAYILPPVYIESEIVRLPSYSIVRRPDSMFLGTESPGPAEYTVPHNEVYLNAPPKYTITSKAAPPSDHASKPGPGDHRPEDCQLHLPGISHFSFGVKHHIKTGEYAQVGPDDEF